MASGGGLSARSFGGCDNCRSRRVKCDETRPSCQLCQATGLICKGYDKNIFFISTNDDVDDASPEDRVRFRRLLFTETERSDMSRQLTLSVPRAFVSKKLLRIDEACENVPQSESLQLQIGPFGVFRDKIQESECRDSQTELDIDWSLGIGIPDINGPSRSAAQKESGRSPPIQHSRQSFLANMMNQYVQDLSSSPPSHICDITDNPGVNVAMGQLGEISPMAAEVQFSFSMNSEAIFNNPTLLQNDMFSNISVDVPHSLYESAFPASPFSNITVPVPGDAVFLLKHYTTNVVNLMTPFGHTRTPWHSLFIPHVKTCLAALTMSEDLSHASLTIFFGTLAVSASSLGRMSPTPGSIWSRRAKLYGKYAREHCQAALTTAYDVPKVAKYKTILMALLTMTQLYNVTANHQHIDFYLVEAEKFIRLKGLNRPKSRKVRLLHHCYAFQRVFYESLYVDSNSKHRREVREAIESSGSSVYSIDSLSFHVIPPQWRNLPHDMLSVKSLEIGENDLHLERPGIWPPTLYPEIYGVPEILVFFLSCIIRLSKAKDSGAHRQALGGGLNITGYLDLAKILETCIKQYQRQHDNTITEIDAPRVNEDPKANGSTLIANAVHNALSIYFYRKIYDVDASLLQHLVSNVLASLTLHQCIGSGFASEGSLCLVWPALIAACEAKDATMRKAFSEWFTNCARNSGLRTFNITLRAVEEAWTRQASCPTVT